jgi:hypothetical protein
MRVRQDKWNVKPKKEWWKLEAGARLFVDKLLCSPLIFFVLIGPVDYKREDELRRVRLLCHPGRLCHFPCKVPPLSSPAGCDFLVNPVCVPKSSVPFCAELSYSETGDEGKYPWGACGQDHHNWDSLIRVLVIGYCVTRCGDWPWTAIFW